MPYKAFVMKGLYLLSAVFLLVVAYPAFAEEEPCVTGGCSGELCTSSENGPAISICIWKDEFECYVKHGTCGLQENGTCGWLHTEEFTACLKKYGIVDDSQDLLLKKIRDDSENY